MRALRISLLVGLVALLATCDEGNVLSNTAWLEIEPSQSAQYIQGQVPPCDIALEADFPAAAREHYINDCWLESTFPDQGSSVQLTRLSNDTYRFDPGSHSRVGMNTLRVELHENKGRIEDLERRQAQCDDEADRVRERLQNEKDPIRREEFQQRIAYWESLSALTQLEIDRLSQPAEVKQVTFEVVALLEITSSSLDDATVGWPYFGSVSRSGGKAPYVWIATGLPAGLVMNPITGQILGSTTEDGTFSVVVDLTDGSGQSARRTLSLRVRPVVLTLYFSGSGNTIDMWKPSESTWGSPELVAEMHRLDGSSPYLIYGGPNYKAHVNGIGVGDVIGLADPSSPLATRGWSKCLGEGKAALNEVLSTHDGGAVVLNIVGQSRGGILCMKWRAGWPTVPSAGSGRSTSSRLTPCPGSSVCRNTWRTQSEG
jgi:hypothetical protein